jgi:hypothetical protein
MYSMSKRQRNSSMPLQSSMCSSELKPFSWMAGGPDPPSKLTCRITLSTISSSFYSNGM